jgi:signal transduction histidine kinase
VHRPARHGAAVTPATRSTLLIASGTFSLTWLALAALSVVGHRHLDARLDAMDDLLTAGAALAGVALGILVGVQRRVSPLHGRTFGAGLGLILEGALVLYVGQLYPFSQAVAHSPVMAFLPPAAVILAIGLLGWSVAINRSASANWSGGRWILAAAGLTALTAVFRFVPSLAGSLSPTVPSGGNARWVAGQLLLALAWCVVAGLAILRPFKRSIGPRDVAVGVVALGLAQSRVALILAHRGAGSWLLGAHVFQVLGFAIAFSVMAREFSSRVRSREDQLMDSLIDARTETARRQARHMIEAVRRHDTHSALFAISGAAQLLDRRYGELTDAQRSALTGILADGVGQLSGLVKVRPDEVDELDIEMVVRSVVENERDSMMCVSSAVPERLRGVGCADDLTVVLQTLIRLAGGQSVAVRGREERGFVVLSVEGVGFSQAGPAVPSLQDSLDLEVASRLMTDQGGTISMGNAEGGGISFGVRLPSIPAADLDMEKGALR